MGHLYVLFNERESVHLFSPMLEGVTDILLFSFVSASHALAASLLSGDTVCKYFHPFSREYLLHSHLTEDQEGRCSAIEHRKAEPKRRLFKP